MTSELATETQQLGAATKNKLTVGLAVGISGTFSIQASRVEETNSFKRDVTKLIQRLELPRSIEVDGVTLNQDEEAVISDSLRRIPEFASNLIQPVMDALDTCWWNPITDAWHRERSFRLYLADKARFMTLEDAVDVWAEKNAGASPQALHELRQQELALFVRWSAPLA